VRVFSFLTEREAVPAVVDLGGERTVSGIAPSTAGPAPASLPAGPSASPSDATMVRVPLIELAWARSGDKGDAFNIGVIARRPELLPWIRAALTEAAVREFFAHEFEGAETATVTRYEVPGLNALNFHLTQSLGGGQMATLRLDALAKGKAQQLLDFEVVVPTGLLEWANDAA